MLNQPLFKITSLIHQQSLISAVLEIDPNCEIFGGHFPDEPVVPGACMLQVIKEVLADSLHQPTRLINANNIKFLSLVTPSAKSLQLNISYVLAAPDVKVNVTLSFGNLVCMKLQGTFVII